VPAKETSVVAAQSPLSGLDAVTTTPDSTDQIVSDEEAAAVLAMLEE
jgi:hypothetical protein